MVGADKQKKGRPSKTGLIEPSSPQLCPILACVLFIFLFTNKQICVFMNTSYADKCIHQIYLLFIHNRLIATSLAFSMYFSVLRPIWSSFCRKTNKIFCLFFGKSPRKDWSLVVLREILPQSPQSFYLGNKCIHHWTER